MEPSATGSNRRVGRHVVHVGVISDTHGQLRPEAVSALHGCALILHAGDIGRAQVLEDLHRLAPRVVAVRGNVDGAWAADVPHRAEVGVEGHLVLLLHDIAQLDLDPRAKGMDVVVSGHSHRPRIERRDGVLYLNPGSAGPRRFRLPVAVARLEVSRSRVDAAIVELDV
jgi:putative phosphoesterase